MVAGIGWLYVHFGKLPAMAEASSMELSPSSSQSSFKPSGALRRTAVKTTFLNGFVRRRLRLLCYLFLVCIRCCCFYWPVEWRAYPL